MSIIVLDWSNTLNMSVECEYIFHGEFLRPLHNAKINHMINDNDNWQDKLFHVECSALNNLDCWLLSITVQGIH